MAGPTTGLRFDTRDQEAFAALCGDRNPIHLDPAVARRSPFGTCIVHGCHVALAALEATLAEQPGQGTPASISATFSRPVAVGATVAASHRPDGERLRIEVADAGGTTTTVVLEGDAGAPDDTPVGGLHGHPTQPHDTQPAVGLTGTLPLGMDRGEAAARFPHVLALLGGHRLASLAAISTVVGMHCPGRRSILSAWTAEFIASDLPADVCAYEVTAFDDRFGMVTLEVRTATMRARVKAFARPDTVQQPTAAELQHVVAPTAFAGTGVLVVGGSRGLGEVAAKLLALGGADVTITYREGAADAQHIVDELAALGRTVTAVHYDVAHPERLPDAARHPNVLAYFPTPPVFVGGRTFDDALLQRFRAVSVTGLQATFAACDGPALRGLLFPSSVAVEQPPAGLAEYAAAKREAEVWCAALAAARPGLAVVVPRLPRMATDQTATVVPVEAADPVAVLLPLLHTVAAQAQR
jgi:acyl dehydratase